MIEDAGRVAPIATLKDVIGVTLALRGAMIQLFAAIKVSPASGDPQVAAALDKFLENDNVTDEWLRGMLDEYKNAAE